MPLNNLYSKKGVEIFSAGEWNGDEYTLEDLNQMVHAFNETRQGVPPYLKLGHDPKQKLIQDDGLPAAGWIDKLYVVGDKLKADFIDIPKKIYDLIENRAYKKVSSEIIWNAKIGEKTYRRMLAAVALLGADTPGVMNLNDILAMYKQSGTVEKVYISQPLELTDSESSTKKGGTMPETKTEKEVRLEYDLQKSESELKTATEKLAEAERLQAQKDEELAQLKKFKADAEAEKQKLLADNRATEIKAFVTELKSEKLCTPAMETAIVDLLGEEKKEYSVKVQDKEEKLNKDQLLKHVLKLFKAAADVNFDESSEAGDADAGKQNEKEIDTKAKDYAAKHKVTYSQALKAVLKEQKTK